MTGTRLALSLATCRTQTTQSAAACGQLAADLVAKAFDARFSSALSSRSRGEGFHAALAVASQSRAFAEPVLMNRIHVWRP